LGSNIRLIAPLLQAASRRTTNSNPSEDMRVTYLLRPWDLSVDVSIVNEGCGKAPTRCGKRDFTKRGETQLGHHEISTPDIK
jgi:hypothetical protein